MGRHCHLVCVTQNNNNKYYDMTEQGDTLLVAYGRIGSTKTEKVYPISKWNSLYNQKIGKGYRDETALAAVQTDRKSVV